MIQAGERCLELHGFPKRPRDISLACAQQDHKRVKPEMRKQLCFIFPAWITLATVLIFAGCHSSKGSDANAAETPSARVATAQRGDIAHNLSLAGQFQPFQVVDVHPKVTGFMKRINVDIGDRVHKGETLAVLEVPELAAQLQGTVYGIQTANAEMIRAQHEIKRAEALRSALHADYQRLLETSKAQPGLIAQQELDDAQAKDLSAEAQVDAAKAAADGATQHTQEARSEKDRVQALESYTNVTAPLDGVVIWRYADTGALIQSGVNSNEQDIPIVRLSQSGLLRLRMPVPENDVQYVHDGEEIQVRVDAISRSFTGKVVRFTRSVNFETRTMETEVDVENADLSIAPGMYANAQLELTRVNNVVTIPTEAIVLRGSEANPTPAVYVLDASNRVHIRAVQVGLRGTKLAEIKSGIEPGDKVIMGGQEKYAENEQVSPIITQTQASETVQRLWRRDRHEGRRGRQWRGWAVMPKFALKFPFFILMLCLMVALVGVVNTIRMPVDLFPDIDMPVVVVATFYNGMPPQQIEADITNTFERFFTLAANVDHSESRSLTGVSLIKIYFKPGTDPNAALSNVANLAMADLRRLPPGTLPPVVLGMTASTQPVCLVTLKGQGLNETNLKDLAQFQVRNQISNVQGASVPQPYGGTYRQIQIYVDPLKLEARNLSLNDVVKAVNESNLILPAGDVRIGNKDYNIYANSQFPDAKSMNQMPLKSVGNSSVLVADIGHAEDSGALQYNIVRIDGQRSVYVPVFKQGGDSNTITIVDGMKAAIKHLVDIPQSLKTAVVFDQSIFVKLAIKQPGEGSDHRAGADRHHDPGLPGQPARDLRGDAVDSAFRAGVPAADQRHGRLDQHHDPGRPGAGFLAPDRRLRGGAREHLPLHGDGEPAARSRGKGRHGGFTGGAGGDFDDVDRVFPGDVSLRHQQVHLHAPGAGRGALNLRLLLLRHDRGAALLRACSSALILTGRK